MNVYKACTLNDNWFEERAPALRGVLVDYGDRCYRSSYSDTFQAKQKNNQYSRAACRAKVTSSNANLFMAETCTAEIALEVASLEGYRAGYNLSPSKATRGEDHYQSTYASDFGSSTGRENCSHHPPIIKTGQKVERGIATSGMIGEAFKNGADPQKNTAAQRVWLPTSTLIIDPATRCHRE